MSSDETNPFQSPQSIDAPVSVGIPPGRNTVLEYPFESGHTRAMWAVGMILAVMCLDVMLAGSTYLQIGLLDRVRLGLRPTPAQAAANNARQQLLALAKLAFYIGSAIPFLMWFHRAHRNLPALGNRRLEYTPGWAVGAWFVPILNLFRPYQIMREVWKGSDPENLQTSYPGGAGGSAMVGWWWALFIVMGVSGNMTNINSTDRSLDGLITTSWTLIVSSLLSLPAGLLAILMVRAVDANQQQRYQLFLDQAAAAPPKRPETPADDFPFVAPVSKEPWTPPEDEGEYPRFT